MFRKFPRPWVTIIYGCPLKGIHSFLFLRTCILQLRSLFTVPFLALYFICWGYIIKPTCYFEDDEGHLVPWLIVSGRCILDDFPVPCNCLKCARANACPCRVIGVACCKFCKCEAREFCKNSLNMHWAVIIPEISIFCFVENLLLFSVFRSSH